MPCLDLCGARLCRQGRTLLPEKRQQAAAAQGRIYVGRGAVEIIPSFRGDAKHRTTMCNCTSENLEIPRCAVAHLRSGPSDHPGMTESDFARSLPTVIARSPCDEAIHSFFAARWIASRSLSSGA